MTEADDLITLCYRSGYLQQQSRNGAFKPFSWWTCDETKVCTFLLPFFFR